MLLAYLLMSGVLLLLIVWILFYWGAARPERTAEHCAEQLLQQHMTPQQYRQLQEQGYIELSSRLHPGRFYRIFRRRQRVQIYTLNEAGSSEPYQKHSELCVVACDPVPDADLFLAHKWMIESDETSYLALANHLPYWAVR